MQANSQNAVQVIEKLPAPPLRPFIRRFLVVEFPALHYDIHLPDVGSVAAFSFHGGCRIDRDQQAPTAAFTGLHQKLRSHEHYDNHAVLLATFTPVGASAFLRPPLGEFAGTTVDLTEVLSHPQQWDRLHEQLREAPNHQHRIESLEAFLLTRIGFSAPDPLVVAAVTWLEQKAGPQRIGELTQYIGLSQSALERRFRRVVGVSPKKFASLVRLRRAVQLRKTSTDLTMVAQAAGYFDQSHFIKDFRRVTGSTPDTFFRHASPD